MEFVAEESEAVQLGQDKRLHPSRDDSMPLFAHLAQIKFPVQAII
jgi:hypothetical protein